jgi:hypothetical protein
MKKDRFITEMPIKMVHPETHLGWKKPSQNWQGLMLLASLLMLLAIFIQLIK